MADERAETFVRSYEQLKSEVHKVIVGHDEIVEQVLVCLFAGGHVLLEGVPGLGKTLLVRTLAACLDLSFARIQFTPDLMPADIIGTNIIAEDTGGRRHFEFQRGPVFAHVVLADEVNRATPKTQSALLEGMQEGSVTVAGVSHRLPMPFFVLATQNPIEMEGTYPLPEAQLDRFVFKLKVRYPAIEELNEIVDRTTRPQEPTTERVMTAEQVLAFRELVREVPIASHVRTFASLAVMATHPQWEGAPEVTRKYLRYGASPRAAQALVLGGKVLALRAGRFNVSMEDLKAIALPAMRHRVIMNFEGEAEGIDADRLILEVLEAAEAATREGKEVFLR
ncbi:MAG: AAA family ATPase [Candidatus Rokubacteria bacterium]|nr:AAA family ATPase [Candidatus Rokubacteria bacterium]